RASCDSSVGRFDVRYGEGDRARGMGVVIQAAVARIHEHRTPGVDQRARLGDRDALDEVVRGRADTTGVNRPSRQKVRIGSGTKHRGMSDMGVHRFGGTAVVTGWLVVGGQRSSGPFDRRYRFTDTWVNRRGRWQKPQLLAMGDDASATGRG